MEMKSALEQTPHHHPAIARLSRWLPILDWGRHYRRQDLPGDITAGIIVASLLIPQSMAYAMLANLPPQVGLYASIVPVLVYACLGTSRTLAVGPVAVDSLMVGAGLAALGLPSEELVPLALTLALMVGVLQVLMGILRLGFLTNFLSQSVITGFTSAAALLIAFSQMKHILGIKVPNSSTFLALVQGLLQQIGQTNGVTVAIGLASAGVILFFNGPLVTLLRRRGLLDGTILPISKSAPLLLVILSTLTVWAFRLDERFGVTVVGDIPQGLPPFGLPAVSGARVGALLPLAFAISLVGFVEAYSIGQSLASRRRQRVEASQELVAVGAANVSASFTGGYPVTGGLARSVVNFSAGANTGLAAIITAVLIAIVVTFLTPLFYFLPQAALAAIIVVAVVKLIDVATLRRLWVYHRPDAIALLACFFAVLAIGVQTGILLGMGMALLLHIWHTSHPHIAIVGRVGDTEHFRNVARHVVQTCPHVLAVRVDESLYFANMKYLSSYLLTTVSQRPEVQHLVLIGSAINLIDGSALTALENLITDLQAMGVDFYLAEIKGPVRDRLERIGFVDKLGRDRIFLSTDQAMRALDCC